MFTLENLLNIEGLRVPQTKLGAVEGSKATEHTIVETETVISGKVLFLRIGERMGYKCSLHGECYVWEINKC